MSKTENHTIRNFFFSLVTLAIFGVVIFYSIHYLEAGAFDAASATSTSETALETATTIATTTTASSSIMITTVAVATKTLPYATTTFNNADWLQTWGMTTVTGGILHIDAATTTAGGETLLIGGAAWTNYNFQATVDFASGKSVSLLAREKDPNDFVYCDFGDGNVAILQRTAGQDTVINAGQTSNGGAGAEYHLGIKVYGDKVACTINNISVLTGTADQNIPAAGSVGFISWDTKLGASAVSVRGVQVSPLTSDSIVLAPTLPTPQPPAPAPPTLAVATTAPTPPVAPLTPAPTPTSTPLPYTINSFSPDPNWDLWMGSEAITSNALSIGASSTGNGGGIAFDTGTQNWTNYTFTATLDWASGETFGLIAHYTDPNDYSVCTFTQNPLGFLQIDLEQYVNGGRYILGQGYGPSMYPSTVMASIAVQDNYGTCTISNSIVSSPSSVTGYYLAPPLYGGIGFTTWDDATDNSQIMIQNLSVTPL